MNLFAFAQGTNRVYKISDTGVIILSKNPLVSDVEASTFVGNRFFYADEGNRILYEITNFKSFTRVNRGTFPSGCRPVGMTESDGNLYILSNSDSTGDTENKSLWKLSGSSLNSPASATLLVDLPEAHNRVNSIAKVGDDIWMLRQTGQVYRVNDIDSSSRTYTAIGTLGSSGVRSGLVSDGVYVFFCVENGSIYRTTSLTDLGSSEFTEAPTSANFRSLSFGTDPSPIVPPTVAIGGSATRRVGGGSQVSLTGSASDSDGTIVSYAWTISPSGGSFSNTNQATCTWLAPAATTIEQSYTITLTVTDNDGATASASVIVTVATGQAPTVEIESGNRNLLGGQAIALRAIASDPGGTSLSYLWESTLGTLSATTEESITWTAPAGSSLEQTATVTVTVTDDDSLTASASITIKIASTTGPTVSIDSVADTTVDPGDVVNLSASVTGDFPSAASPVTGSYSWSGLGTFSSPTTLQTKWTAPGIGVIDSDIVLTLTARDNFGQVVTDTITLTVQGSSEPFAQGPRSRRVELRAVRSILFEAVELNEEAALVYDIFKESGIVTEGQAVFLAQNVLSLCGPPGWRDSYPTTELDFSADGMIDRFVTDRNLGSVVMNALLGLGGGFTSYRPLIGWESS